MRGSERVLSRSQLATEVFPRVADVVADAMAWVQLHAANPGNTNTLEMAARLDEFRAGKWELHCTRFLRAMGQAPGGDDYPDALTKLEASALERAPQLRNGFGEKLLHQCLGRFWTSAGRKESDE